MGKQKGLTQRKAQKWNQSNTEQLKREHVLVITSIKILLIADFLLSGDIYCKSLFYKDQRLS